MANVTIRLADDPNRFRLRMGEKVAQRDTAGYADSDYSGVIVDGEWTGDPAAKGGAYDERYRVKRDRGGYFDARELDLLKRYDDEAALRQEISDRIKTYSLPKSLPSPPAGELEGHETMRSPMGGETCSACDHKIRPRDPGAIEYEYSMRRVFRFHGQCNAIWLEEIRPT